jgi:endonuclease/exonuclease/phosphatase family metal-dependent hydrolase
MLIDVMAWNLHDAFSREEGSAQAVQDQIFTIGPDIAVLPEARSEGAPLGDSVIAAFKSEGYNTYESNYEDQDSRKDRHGLIVIAKSEAVKDSRVVPLAGRNAIQLSLQNNVDFLGLHLVDRVPTGDNISVGGEIQRLRQTTAALKILGERAIAAGDFNAMPGSSLRARLLRVIKPLVHLLPSTEPEPEVAYDMFGRFGSLSQRLSDMATGRTLVAWDEAGFIDADQGHKPTMAKGPLGFQLDHIFARGVLPSGNAEVRPNHGLSDHKILTATIKI